MLTRLLAALGLTAALLIAAPTAPAHAAWGPSICSQDDGLQPDADWLVCFATHTKTSGGGLLLDQVLICTAHIPGGDDKFRGTKNGTFEEFTGNGTPNGFIRTRDIAVDTCAAIPTGGTRACCWQSGASASVKFRADADMKWQSDRPIVVAGPCCGGGG